MESDFIAWLRSRVPACPQIELGICDDAAILSPSPNPIVITTDMLTEGVDFRRSDCQPEQIGRKALAVNLSDLAAMAAQPVAAFVSLAVSRSENMAFVK